MDACCSEQKSLGHIGPDATAICTMIKDRAAKGMLYKAANSFEIVKTKAGDLWIAGYATWEITDPQHDKITTEGQVDFLRKYFAMDPEYRELSMDHTSTIMAKAHLKFVDPDTGKTYLSHVNEVGTYLVAKVRNDTNLGYVQKYRDLILQGIYKSFSIKGNVVPGTSETVFEGGQATRLVKAVDPIEVAIVQEGMCPKASMTVIHKAKLLKGPFAIAKMATADLKTHLADLYAQRREITDQLYPSTPKLTELSPIQTSTEPNEAEPDELDDDERGELQDELHVLDIEIRSCEDAYSNSVYGDVSKAKSPSLPVLEQLSKMTWEECIASAEANPSVSDPKALCGWLKAYGPNAKSKTDVPVQTVQTVQKSLEQQLTEASEQAVEIFEKGMPAPVEPKAPVLPEVNTAAEIAKAAEESVKVTEDVLVKAELEKQKTAESTMTNQEIFKKYFPERT